MDANKTELLNDRELQKIQSRRSSKLFKGLRKKVVSSGGDRRSSKVKSGEFGSPEPSFGDVFGIVHNAGNGNSDRRFNQRNPMLEPATVESETERARQLSAILNKLSSGSDDGGSSDGFDQHQRPSLLTRSSGRRTPKGPDQTQEFGNGANNTDRADRVQQLSNSAKKMNKAQFLQSHRDRKLKATLSNTMALQLDPELTGYTSSQTLPSLLSLAGVGDVGSGISPAVAATVDSMNEKKSALQMRNDHEAALATQQKEASEKHADTVRHHESVVSQLRADHDAALAATQQEASEKHAHTVRHYESLADQLRADHDAAFAATQQEASEKLAHAVRNHESVVSQLRADHDAALAATQQEASEKHADTVRHHESLLGQEHEFAMAAQEKEASERLADAVRHHESIVDRLRANHDMAMAVQAKEASERLAEIVRYHENLAGQQSEATQEKRTIESLQNRLDEMGAHHDTALAIQQKESSEKFADAVRQHENAVEQLRREHDAARSESTQLKTKMIASHSAMLHQAAEEYMAKIDNLKADHIREMDRKEEQHKRELTLKSLKRMVAVGNRTKKEQQQAFFWRWYSAVAVPVETLLRENPVLAEQLRCGMNGAARRKRRPLKSPALKHSKYSMNSANLSAIGLRTPRVRDSRARAGSTGGKFRPARLEAHIEAEGEGAEWKELVEFW